MTKYFTFILITAFSISYIELQAGHYTPVWSGNPLDPMTIVVTQATLNGTPLIAGDEIGVFDNSNCVGAFILTVPINPASSSTYVYIVCSKDDPGTTPIDGYTPGNTITYKIWKQSASLETIASATFPFTPSGVFAVFTVNETAIVALAVSYTPPGPHFSNVWTGNPIDPMTIVVTQATITGINLNAGDEIGIFDGTFCVGSAILTGTINPNSSGTYLYIVCSKDDPGTTPIDGYTPGHTITYKIWKQSTLLESNATASFPFSPSGVFSVFTVNETAIVALSDVSIPINLDLNNIIVGNGQSNCYDATETINVAGNGTTFIVRSGGIATMIAGQVIHYFPGTKVEPGGYMWGYIAPGGPWCVTPSMPAVVAGEEEPVPLISEKPSFKVFPNPTTGSFKLELPDEPQGDAAQVKVYNMFGAEILEKEIISGRIHEFSLAMQQPGVYLVSVICNGEVGTRKIIRQ